MLSSVRNHRPLGKSGRCEALSQGLNDETPQDNLEVDARRIHDDGRSDALRGG